MINPEKVSAVLLDQDPRRLEELAREAARLTRFHFGHTVSLFAPLYLSNFCENGCLYCGFSRDREIERMRLTPEQYNAEMEAIAREGIRHILLLTGESRKMSPVSYIRGAVETARRHFSAVSLEIYPLNEDEYGELVSAGADGVTLYQETYHREIYSRLHPAGAKSDFDYRFKAPERMGRAGVHRITLGVLLGLAPHIEDIIHLFSHTESLMRKFPGIDFSLSFPRLISIAGMKIPVHPVDDAMLIKLICLTRILFPAIGITLSTRERKIIRDHAVQIGVTRISAASKTVVGGYSSRDCQDGQFSVQDERSVREIISMLKERRLDPVLTEWHSLPACP